MPRPATTRRSWRCATSVRGPTARDHGIGRSAGYRHIDEATAVLTDQAPDLHHVTRRACQGPLSTLDNRTLNKLQWGVRRLGERGFALVTQRWRLLQPITAGPGKIGDVAGAALVLTHFERGSPT